MDTRRAQEKFYTDGMLINDLVGYLPRADVYVEPSAGNGMWLPFLEQTNARVIAFDLYPEGEGITHADWLTTTALADVPSFVVVGNPPFSLAVAFVNRAFELGATHVCFLLPPSFKKPSVQRRLHPEAHLIQDIDFPLVKYYLGATSVAVPSVWQIWERRPGQTREPVGRSRTASPLFTWEPDYTTADIAVRRVGVLAGKFLEPTAELSPESNQFLKFSDRTAVDIIKEILKGSPVPTKDFSKIRSITKYEVIAHVESSENS